MSLICSFKDCPRFKSLLTPSILKLRQLFGSIDSEIRLAGGPVRDLLNGKTPADIDLATTATPTQMVDLFKCHDIRMINEESGLKHGTVTARIPNDENGENFEITTLRIDTKTDGRRAEVEFTQDWKLDANRRDLTINSMFCDLDGNIYDFFNGRRDLMEKKVRFVGQAELRIQEDYLRILRYFRFYGRIAEKENNHDESTIQSIRENAHGMNKISGERIWSEWKKILSGTFGGPLTLKMLECQLSESIGLPVNPNIYRLRETWSRCTNLEKTYLHPITLLSTLLEDESEMLKLHARLKLSGFERDLGLFVISRREKEDVDNLKMWQWEMIDNMQKIKMSDCRAYIVETLLLKGRKDLASEMRDWELPKFPVNGRDLIEKGCNKGRIMSVILKELTDKWKFSDYTLNKEELLDTLPEILDNLKNTALNSPKNKKKKKNK